MNYFNTDELVPPEVYALLGEHSRKLIDPRIVDMLNKLREWANCPIYVNNAARGRSESGLRIPTSKYYSPTSQHSVGKALDSVCDQISAKEFHKEILKNLDMYPDIRFIEIDVNWLHIDCRDNPDDTRMKLWSPTRGYVAIATYLHEIG